MDYQVKNIYTDMLSIDSRLFCVEKQETKTVSTNLALTGSTKEYQYLLYVKYLHVEYTENYDDADEYVEHMYYKLAAKIE